MKAVGVLFGTIIVGLCIIIAFAVYQVGEDSRRERREREDIHLRVRAQITACVEAGGTPEYAVTGSGWLLDFYGCGEVTR